MAMLVVIAGLFTFIAMESVARLAHKYLMHGFLWSLHEDLHRPTAKKSFGFFEKNDWFFIIFAAPSITLYILGGLFTNAFLFAAAIGITLSGIAYFVFHEIVFHRRLNIKWIKAWKSLYVRALRRAHAAHHKHLTHENGECFGLLVFPLKYIKMEMHK